ncbi:ACP S-malonyltransferase [Lactobacillus sp. CC-MHH1034]|uniref:ACP S-malonyltransferase n=1 Tax=Agrilactobacillus fermenti TaxID=2586909 RepID=UPI001E2BA847|nr:ACP S-malonyltransferase [Agrilactobacillus fermenti]MCD2255706.1 ACP S-malonyltransferase [Agrilactobacillus fermenti]
MKLAYLFSGQGSQYEGMGQDLYDNYPEYRTVIDAASQACGFDIQAKVQDPAALANTATLQPMVVAMSLGVHQLLAPQLPVAQAHLGLSLGEYSALIAADAMTLQSGIQLVTKRGQLMQAASEKTAGKMVAVMTKDHERVASICAGITDHGFVSIANYNTAKQVVIGGDAEAVDLAQGLLDADGFKTIPLKVAGAFHTPLMTYAAANLAADLRQTAFQDPQVPTISNTTVKPFDHVNLAETLIDQITNPTHFAQCLVQLGALGIDTLVEVGPGHTLTGFTKKTLKGVKTYHVENQASLEQTITAIQGAM